MERTFRYFRALTLPAAAGLLLCIAGCTSLVGKEYRYGERNTDGTLDGVPFTMNKPVPTVTHTVAADTGKESYQVSFAQVADSSKRFMLQISPSMLASVDFAMTFDAAGSLTEVTAKSGDQTSALIATVGKLAVLAAADTSGEEYEKKVVERMLAFGDGLARAQPDPPVWPGIRRDLTQLGTSQKIRSEYVYATSTELSFLRELSRRLKTLVPKDGFGDGSPTLAPNPGVEAFWLQLKAHTAKDPDFAEQVQKAFSSGDIKALNEMRVDQVTALEGARAGRSATKTDEANKKVLQVLGRITLLKAATQGMPGEIKLANDIAETSLTEWQKRTAAPLSKEMDATQQLLRVAEASQQPATTIDSLKSRHKQLMLKKAAVLGVLREVQRREELTELLTRTSVAKDLKALREERVALDVAIAAAEPSKAKAKVPKADEPSTATYLVEGAGETIGAGEIVNRLGDGERPRYVIVVRSLERPSTPTTPAGDGKQPIKPPVSVPGTAGDLPSPTAPPVPPVKPAKEN